MDKTKLDEMRRLLKNLLCSTLLIITFSTVHAPKANSQGIPTFDIANFFATRTFQRLEDASNVLRNVILPLKRSISEIGEFFRETKENVNIVVTNLKLAKELIDTLPQLEKNFLKAIRFVQQAEHIRPRWKYGYQLAELWYRSKEVIEVFRLAYDRDKGLMNDEQRIRLIDDTLRRLKKVNKALLTQHHRNLKLEMTLYSAKEEIKSFEKIFGYN